MATYQLPDGTQLSDSMPFRWQGVQYPDNWIRLSTEEDRERIGLEGPLPEPEPYDQVFYWGPDQPKDHGQLVEEYSGHVRRNASALLSDTDWMVIRKADTGVPLDPAVAAWRQAVRVAAGEKVSAVEATTSTEGLAAYIRGEEYPVWPELEAVPAEDPGDWSGFFDQLLVSNVFALARQAAAVDVSANACYTDLAAGLALAKQGNPNVAALQVGLTNMLAALELSAEQLAELATLIEQTGVPLQLPN